MLILSPDLLIFHMGFIIGKLFKVKIIYTTFYLHLLQKITSLFIPEFLKKPIVLFSIPEKEVILYSRLYCFFTCWGRQQFELTCTRNT